MKYLLLTLLLILTGCTKVVPADKLVERQGIVYEVNSQTPFTGIGVAYHANGQLEYRENFKDGEFVDGITEYYYDNGQLRRKNGTIDGGLMHGLDEKYLRDGTLESGYPKCYQNGEEVDLSICKQ